MSKPITFPIVKGTDDRRNAETGVVIRKSDDWYLVLAPTHGGFDVVGEEKSLKTAREWAIERVELCRENIAEARGEAVAEHAAREHAARARALCLRADGVHVVHMMARSASCREVPSDEPEPPVALTRDEPTDRETPSPEDDIHYWPSASGSCPPELASDLSACGVNIMTTPYTFGSPEWSEVTCGYCRVLRPVGRVEVVHIGGGRTISEFKARPQQAGLTPEMVDTQAAAYAMASEVIADARQPQVPTDLDDDAAWAAYCAALPEPTMAELAATEAEFAEPWATLIAQSREAFKASARLIWTLRSKGWLDDESYRTLRETMTLHRTCIENYRTMARTAVSA